MTAPRTLAQWLSHCERLHAKPIDLSLDRVRAVCERLDLRIAAPVITVAGTNGKGSTCAVTESIARHAGYRTGMYLSPHLVDFEERCRLDGVPADAATLLPHFEAVEAARGDTTLTYFEHTTLVILRALAAARPDLVILEVGLGGRLDAVNVVDADVAVITSVDIDHVEYLGPDRESIGLEKAHIMRPGRPAVLSDPMPPASVLAHGRAIGADLWCQGRDFGFQGDRQQWSWYGRGRRYHALGHPALRGANQLLNASGAIAALEALRERLPITAQAVRSGLAGVELPGRFQIVPGQPTLVLDVAHNAQAASVLARNLDAMGFYPRTHAVMGAMRDKDLDALIGRMRPVIDEWHFCDLDTPRAAHADELRAVLAASDLAAATAATTHASAPQALAAALGRATPADRIVVFGSFYTVGGVLKAGLPRTAAPHAV